MISASGVHSSQTAGRFVQDVVVTVLWSGVRRLTHYKALNRPREIGGWLRNKLDAQVGGGGGYDQHEHIDSVSF